MADNSDTEVLAGIFGGLVVAIACVAVVIGTADGAKSATSPQPVPSMEPNPDAVQPSPAVTMQNADPRELPPAEKRKM
jgi:hypothetical protein